MLDIVVMGQGREENKLSGMRARAAEAGAEVELAVGRMLEEVRLRGYEAVCEYSRRFDGRDPMELDRNMLKAAAERIDPALLKALKRSADNIRGYQERLREEIRFGTVLWDSPDGGRVGRTVRPLRRVGVYVPGGRAAYPSSVLMNVIPAKVAGVEEVVMVTPPTENLNDAVLAAAWLAGVDRCFAVGGVQAIGALTYGAGPIPAVDKIVGPGNAYVAAAKRMAFGKIDIDMVAGPSEVLIISDESADPKWIAADLLSQAEHDPLASAVLVTTSMELAVRVNAEIRRQMGYLSRSEVMAASLRDYGCAFVCQNMEECAAFADRIAPEHLEIVVREPEKVMAMVHNAGAIFLGPYTPEPVGDYMAGPDHVLPTGGTARFFSPLSVDAFVKKTSVLSYSCEDLARVKDDIVNLAQAEQLTAHANSILVRFER